MNGQGAIGAEHPKRQLDPKIHYLSFYITTQGVLTEC